MYIWREEVAWAENVLRAGENLWDMLIWEGLGMRACVLEGLDRLLVHLFLCSSMCIFLWYLEFFHRDLSSHVLTSDPPSAWQERPSVPGWLADPGHHCHHGWSRVHACLWCQWDSCPDFPPDSSWSKPIGLLSKFFPTPTHGGVPYPVFILLYLGRYSIKCSFFWTFTQSLIPCLAMASHVCYSTPCTLLAIFLPVPLTPFQA